MKHTKGPWTIGLYRTTPEFREHEEHVAVMDGDGLLLAITGPSLDKASVADAKLIAAAPELLGFAKHVLGQINSGACGYINGAEAELKGYAEQLIAKAEGKE